MNVEFDVSELWPLADDLGASGSKVLAGVRGVVEKGAVNVKADMQREFASSGHAKHASKAIDYDVRVTFGGAVEAEIGFNKGKRQGALGNILAFGTSRNGPQGDITAGLRAEEPRMRDALIRLAVESLG